MLRRPAEKNRRVYLRKHGFMPTICGAREADLLPDLSPDFLSTASDAPLNRSRLC